MKKYDPISTVLVLFCTVCFIPLFTKAITSGHWFASIVWITLISLFVSILVSEYRYYKASTQSRSNKSKLN